MDVGLFMLNFLNNYKLENKFFIEAGANDGIVVSNTLLLELQNGWTGCCVEPNFENYKKLTQNRKNSICFHGALVSSQYGEKTIKGIFNSDSISRENGLMSGCTEEHLIDFPNWICEVPALTLTEVLLKSNSPDNPDFLSLDVENNEIEALSGLDFNIFRPRIILMEIGKWYIKDVFEEHFDFMTSRGYKFHSTPKNWNPFNGEKNLAGDNNFIFIDL